MSSKNELIKINNQVASMTPEERTQYDLELIKNRQRMAETDRKAKEKEMAEKRKWRQIEEEEKERRERAAINYELANAPKEFMKYYEELKVIDAKIRSLSTYGTVDRQEEIDKLKQEFEKIKLKALAVPWKSYPITFIEQHSFVSKVNPEHKLFRENGTWKIRGFEELSNTGTSFEFDGKTGLPTKIKAKKRIMRLFSKPFEVPVIHEVSYVTQEQLEAQRLKEAKKKGPAKRLVPEPKNWKCSRCQQPNDKKNKFCGACGKLKEPWQ